ncbi:cysteinyl leukotriene receptor 2-like [Lingula anatina]|uniref:Cysteinyl leukotriene receptor 2-like n=1 Tax=Lingula anatina TaxID=7574 RepID=A0A1S3HG11_LINAN|nr:cysteinyl leukotriene receptor 2-like [Lingula anatina]XP_013384992.1 cysteinyl leukotriene receptor 2-like [Lingula anatina]XP_023930556.1 cysteinyl leukotriene receptor 2-like [Lingula anatina]|eukprot:XP_013384991.1 cysteinyl leukotriene receptor 2-like [Lingula anatina]
MGSIDQFFESLGKEEFHPLSNTSLGNFTGINQTLKGNESIILFPPGTSDPLILTVGQKFYAVVTPIIIGIGLCGNILSFNVFVSKSMRSLSASCYLAALSLSDILVLLIYVLLDWLTRGLAFLTGSYAAGHILSRNGVCHMFLYFSYVMRFMSVWLIVAFTIERYIGVCRPLLRLRMCTRSYARKTITIYVIAAFILSLYKPVLSGVYEVNKITKEKVCTHNSEFKTLSYVIDMIFGMSITLVPFVIISVLNVLMVRKLVARSRNRRRGVFGMVQVQENKIRMEMTIILLGLSTCFVMLNMPYFVTWCLHMYRTFPSRETDVDFRYSRGALHVTRTIYFFNYCVNFFLYSISGACFRKELRALFTYRRLQRRSSSLRSMRSSILRNESNQRTDSADNTIL